MTPSRLASVAATLALCSLGAHAQSSNWQSVASACVPLSAAAAQQVQVVNNGSYLRAPLAGRNPPTINYACNVLDPSNGTVPAWIRLVLQYADATGNAVSATLYAKSKSNGAVSNVASVSSLASSSVTSVSVAIPVLDFAINSYYVLLTLRPQASTQPQLHSVSLVE